MAQVPEIVVKDATGADKEVATLTAVVALIGAVDDEPIANTLLARLKAIADAAAALTEAIRPATHAEPVTPHDSTDLAVPSRAIFVGTGGDLTAVVDGTPRLFANVPSGTRLDIVATRINATGTDAEDMVSLS